MGNGILSTQWILSTRQESSHSCGLTNGWWIWWAAMFMGMAGASMWIVETVGVQ